MSVEVQRSTTVRRSANVQRSGTRKGPNPNLNPAAPKKQKGYEIVQQGIKELYPLDKGNIVPDLEYVQFIGKHLFHFILTAVIALCLFQD